MRTGDFTKRAVGLVLAALAGLAWVDTADAAEIRSLEPAGPWNMHYAGQTCMLRRAFGTGDNEIIAQVERGAPSSSFSLTLVGKALKSKDNVSFLSILFDPGGSPQSRNVPAGHTTGAAELPTLYYEGAFLIAKPRETDFTDFFVTPEQEERVTRLRIRQRLRPELALELGSMGKPMAALRKCAGEVVKLWGLDPATELTLQRKPQPLSPPNSWLSAADFPQSGLLGGPSAVLRIRLLIDASGAITDCTVTSQSEGPEFTGPTCELIRKRAHFAPALDKDGKPTAWLWTTSVSWLN